MKYFHKLFFSIVLLLTAAIATMGYFSVALSLEQALDNRIESDLEQHQSIKYGLQSSISNLQQEEITEYEYQKIAENTSLLLEGYGGLQLSKVNGEIYYSTLSSIVDAKQMEEGVLNYYITTTLVGEQTLRIESVLNVDEEQLHLVTEKSISAVFEQADNLQGQYVWIYLVVLLVGAVFTALLTILFTRPIRSLQKTSLLFAAGDYEARSTVRSHDEIGELAKAYNHMAKSLEDKIYELEEYADKQQQFTANFAHELKTPMTSIIGYADKIYQKRLSQEDIRKCAWYIVNEGMRLESLSFKLLELQTLRKTDFLLEEAEMSIVLMDTIETVVPLAEKKNVQIRYAIVEGWVRLEYDLFKTLLLNLMDNAIKSGAKIILLETKIINEKYQISITDNGRGMEPEELQRITEAFYMVDKARSRKEHGAGLGLSLASQIAKIHHTQLRFRSAVNQGTLVSLELNLEENIDETENNQ